MCNINIQKEKDRYKNQIERQGGFACTEPQPDSDSWLESQNERQGWLRHEKSQPQPDGGSWLEA